MAPRQAVTWPVSPMKAATGVMPRGGEWAYEPKWDGHRVLVRVLGDEVAAISSTGLSRVERWPWLRDLRELIGDDDAVIDGEVIAYDDAGRHSFGLIGRPDRPHAFVAFDVLAAGGRDVMDRPWTERRALLEQIVHPGPQLLVTPVGDDPDVMWEVTKAAGFEGVLAKRRDSVYLPGRRSPTWRKVKHRLEQEMVVGGYQLGEGNRASTFGSLLLGVMDGGVLRYAGSVGTGFDERLLRQLTARLRELATDRCPFDPVPTIVRVPKSRLRWVHPELVVQVQFGEWTEAGIIRHPVFLGLRDDKSPAEVVRERA